MIKLTIFFLLHKHPQCYLFIQIVLLVFFLSFNLYSQKQSPIFQHIKPEHGLNNRFNAFIKKDSKGLVWISSMEGLHCFDGLDLRTYRPSEQNGMKGKDIQSDFFEDNNSNIWFTSLNAINCYQRKTDDFSAYQLVDENKNLIENGYCLFYLERDSVLWLKAEQGIYKYNIHNQKQEKITSTDGVRFAIDTFKNGQLRQIIACPWLNNNGVEVITLDIYHKFRKDTFLRVGFHPNYNQSLEVAQAAIENDTLAWLFTDQGLISFNPKKKELPISYPLPAGYTNIINNGEILNDFHIAVSAKNSGLWLFDRKQKKYVSHYSSDNCDDTGIVSNSLWEIYYDHQNFLWSSNFHEAAIDYSPIYQQQFKNPFFNLPNVSPAITSIIEDKQEHIWCSTVKDGIYILGLNGQVIQHFSYDIFDGLETIAAKTVYQLSIDKDGHVWARGDRFIALYKNDTWSMVFYTKDAILYSLLHLSNTQKIISSNKGVFEIAYDESTNETRIKVDGFIDKTLQVFHFFSGAKKNYYFPHNGNFLSVFSTQNNDLVLDTSIHVGTDVYDILEDTIKKELLLATANGLIKLDLQTFSFSNFYQSKEELKNIQFYSVEKDRKGKIWLPTNQGLLVNEPTPKRILQYNVADGLASTQFTLFGHLTASNGTIWLGTNKGIVYFSPDSIKPYAFRPRIYLKSLRVNNISFKTEHVINETDVIDLKHHQNSLNFEVVGVTNYLPEQANIFYRLTGFDDNWKKIKNGSNIQFTKIPYDSYKLEIYAENANRIQGKTRVLDINIHPPYWMTWWFWILMGSLIILSVFLFVRYIINQHVLKERKILEEKQQAERVEFERQKALEKAEFERQKALEKALQDERNRIADDMHDDLGGKLSSIQFLLRPIKKESLSPKANENLHKVALYADESIDNMRDIIWAMNSNHDNLNALIAHTRWKIIDFFEDHNLNCNIPLSEEVPNFFLKGKQRRNIFMCIKEAAHNIVKHAEANNISILFEYEDMLKITVKDDGKGIDMNAIRQNQLGNGQRTMQKRMTEIEGTFHIINDKGTTIYFTIPFNIDNNRVKSL